MKLGWVVVSLSALLLLSGCTGGTGTEAQARAETVEVKAKEYRFIPARVEVAKGTRVTVRMLNVGTERHEWELPAYNVEIKPVQPGATGEVIFLADKAGTYEFLCDIEDHYERGMRGFLVVKER